MRRDLLQKYKTEGGVELEILLAASDSLQQIFGDAMLDAFNLPGDAGGSAALQFLNAMDRLRDMSDEQRQNIVAEIVQKTILTMARFRMIRIPPKVYNETLSDLRRVAREKGARLPVEKRAAVMHRLCTGNDFFRIYEILQKETPAFGVRPA